MDPLIKIKESVQKDLIPYSLYELVLKRFPLVVEGINRIEKASGIHFPVAYVEPSVIISNQSNSYSYGILFARTLPLVYEDRLQVVIQITAPLVAFGLKGTIQAILAHEFLHYLELVRKISKMELLSDEISSNLFESVYADETRLFESRAVFSDRGLLEHITKRFPSGFRDYKLEDKTIRSWIEKKLPTVNISLDTNIVKLPVDALSKISFDQSFVNKLVALEQKSKKIQKKKYF